MRSTQYKYNDLPNAGYILYKLSDDDIAVLNTATSLIQNDFDIAVKANYDLAGNIEHEYDLLPDTNSFIQELVIPLGFEYLQRVNFQSIVMRYDIGNISKLKLDNSWVNFQQKHEFNPPHTHTGLLSFVIWLKVPYMIDDEKAFSLRIPHHKNYAGCFEFTYTDTIGSIINNIIPVDKTWEGTLCIFPSKMKHAVYPFYTSDDYRISISGNLHYAG